MKNASKPNEHTVEDNSASVGEEAVNPALARLAQLKAAAYDTRKEIDRLSTLYNRIEAEIQNLTLPK